MPQPHTVVKNCVNIVTEDQTCEAVEFFSCSWTAKKEKRKRRTPNTKTHFLPFPPTSCRQAPTVVTSGWSHDLPRLRADGAIPHVIQRVTEVLKTDQMRISSLGEKLHLFFFFLVSLHWWSDKSANTDTCKHTHTHNASDKQHARSRGLFTHAEVLQRTHNKRAQQPQESPGFTLPAFRGRRKKNLNGCFTAIKHY